MRLPKKAGSKISTVILTAGIAASTNSSAEMDGLGLIPADTWQEGTQLLMSSSALIAEFTQYETLIKPFIVPQAKSHAVTTFRDETVQLQLQAKHLNEDGTINNDLQWTIAGGPKHGTLSGAAPNLSYTPNQDFTGYDRVVFEVQDTEGFKTRGVIDINVNGSYTLFESGQVRPIAMNSAGDRLYALNTPDGKLEIFDITDVEPRHLTSVNVGLEPVAVSLRNDNEAWIVNTLSDSVSIVDLRLDQPTVVRTLHVGDEPQDVVFAGTDKEKAFITTARRGQHSPSGLKPTTPSVGRADVWVFNAIAPADKPEHIINLYGMAPRGLATSPDGSKVYAAIYKSGNKTAVGAHNYSLLADTSTYNNKPGPSTDANGIEAPNTGVIVKHDGEHWRDLYGTNWDEQIYFDLPDYDVFMLDTNNLSVGAVSRYSGVGNALFNMAVNPVNGSVYVSNMDARNELEFEGHGKRSDLQTLRGRFIKNQITVINTDGTVLPRDLNPHLDDSRPDGSVSDNAKSLSMPLEMAIDSTGETIYVTAYGSSKIGILSTAELEAGNMQASEGKQIEVSGGGPAGIILDENRDRLYVLTRFNNAIAVIDTKQKREVASVPMYNPEPDFVVEGRPFLYDARFSSGRGDSSCGSCHLFGDMDGLSWNLGNPDGVITDNPTPYTNNLITGPALPIHHPLKGPMLTQSLRGLEFQGPQHWRGDRTGKVQVNGESLERAAFKEFSGAFTELLGKEEEPSEDQMNKFADFVLQMRYPPNPNRNMDDTLTPKAERGADIYFNKKTTGFRSVDDKLKIFCNDCHEVNPDIERFGTDTFMSFEGAENEQDQKVPHLRNIYARIGMFGQTLRSDDNTSTGKYMGDQVTGFGLTHDGSVDTLETFLTLRIFHVAGEDVPELFEYVTQVPTGLAPIVGQQATLTPSNQSQAKLIDLMEIEALAHTRGDASKKKCDLVAWGRIDDQSQSFMMTGANRFVSDSGKSYTGNTLRQETMQSGNSLTYMCAPPGSGHRIALDRDEDGEMNATDLVAKGSKVTSISPVNPLAPTKYLTMPPLEDTTFDRVKSQKLLGIYPDFNNFVFLGILSPEGLTQPPPYDESEYFGGGNSHPTSTSNPNVTVESGTSASSISTAGGGSISTAGGGSISTAGGGSTGLWGLFALMAMFAARQTRQRRFRQGGG